MTTTGDPFYPDNLRINPEILDQPVSRVRRYKKQSRIKFYQFDTEVLDRLFAATKCATLAVLMALEELHFTDFDHRNPVRLTSFNLQRFGLTRKQKYRALRILERAKLIRVERMNGKNPLVTMMWHPIGEVTCPAKGH